MKKTFSIAVSSLIALSIMVTSLHAQLIVDVTGTAGSGSTTWTFSGSAVAAGSTGAAFQTDPTGGNDAGNWLDFAEYTDVNNTNFSIASGSASVSVNGTSNESLTGIYIDTDSAADPTADDWGIAVANNLAFSVGDSVSWSGAVDIGIDLNDLDNTALPVTYTTSNIGGSGAALSMQMNIIPEPSSLGILAACSAALLIFRPRRH